MIKKFFNLIFPEKFKQCLREKFNFVFQSIDRRLMYRDYIKACKKILRPMFFSCRPYNYRERNDENLIFNRIRGRYLKEIYKKRLKSDEELRECFKYIDKFGIDTFCYEDMHQEIFKTEDVHFDDVKKLYYVFYKSKKLYLKRSVDTVEKVLEIMNSLANEQLPQSPHCYLTDDFKPDYGGIVFDIGCAEGNFALEVIDTISKVYLFECDEEWVEALEATFEPYKEKVCIVRKLVSDESSENCVTIDDFCSSNNIRDINFVKMDVEGFEQKVLRGGKNMIAENSIKRIAACLYHNYSDEKDIRCMLKNIKFSHDGGGVLNRSA